ncbi:thiopurine S-methyltransferase [Acetobacter pomorum]|uniref:Thiopurine S-methyltransferase n=1 Tax=Acetobacter pomorum TaxID=65959 RepID=A0A2G4REL8_9PROT|nr:thiopurine S-methyltransferase [Acetobacter pomorum]PHY95014.1 thiopurine S-methyltransferase [Acetobacter pomorum]GBR54789.1 thiopurine S-methyltransferase [Acetobacter pomorum DSM 11825]
MDAQFWNVKWQKNQIGFHLPSVNPLLVKHFSVLNLHKGARIFVPLCGKTLDIHWLLQREMDVVGIELSQIAVEQLFSELGISPRISNITSGMLCFEAENICIFVGDIFALSSQLLGDVHAIYDRAALIALPQVMRATYAKHLMNISNKAQQLLVTLEYDQSLMKGPPFSVNQKEIQKYYGADYAIKCLESTDVEGGLKGCVPAAEKVWFLNPEYSE